MKPDLVKFAERIMDASREWEPGLPLSEVIEIAEACGVLELYFTKEGYPLNRRVPLREAAEAGQTRQER